MRRLGAVDDMEDVLAPVSLAARIRALPKELQRVVGKVYIPADNGEAIVDALRRGDKVYGVSDGSFSKGYAAHGWKLTRRPNDPMAIKGHGPVDGIAPTAFRAEMQGQVVVLIVSSLLVADRGVRGAHILSLCDNQATLRRLSEYSKALRVRDQLSSEVDLFLIYRDWMKKRHIRCTRKWVKGHQDRKKPLHEIGPEGILNIEVDELATSAYSKAGVDKTSLEVDIFAHEVYGVLIDGSKLTTRMKARVIDRCGESAMLQYLTKKHRLSDGKLEGIDWTALSSFLRTLPPHKRALQVKLSHNWIPTQSFLYQQKHVPCDQCPLCQSAIETHEHVWQCRAPVAVQYRRDRFVRLEHELKGINTAPEIVRCWQEQLAALCGDSVDDSMSEIVSSVELKRALGEARRHQAILSWTGLLQGRISVHWRRVQECHERLRRQESASLRRTGPWSTQAVRMLCLFHCDLWGFRNNEVHGRTVQEEQQKVRQSVENAVKSLYARNPVLLARYPSIHSVPVSVRLKRPTIVLQMWLKQIAWQERITVAVSNKAAMKAGSILPFLVERRFLGARRGVAGAFCSNKCSLVERLVRWARGCLRRRSRVELPRAGIGDPG